MKRQSKQKKQWYTIGALLVFNLATAAVIATLFFPQWLPFLHAKQADPIPEVIAPQDGTKTEDEKTVIAGKPAQISLPSVKVDLPIIDGIYDAQKATWTLSDDKAHYALLTPFANNVQGNTFIYGHNTKKVFGPLLKLKVGDKAFLKTDNGKTFEYVLRSSKDVKPSDVSLFYYQGAPILTLQTCAGAWDQNRRLFTFDFEKVSG